MPLAIIVTGFGSNYPSDQVADLEAKGYDVEVYSYYSTDLPDSNSLSSGDMVIGHSLGGTRVQSAYSGSDAQVYSFGSPTKFGGSNVNHISNSWDVISWLSGNIPSFSKFGRGAHSLDTYYKNEFGDSSDQEVGTIASRYPPRTRKSRYGGGARARYYRGRKETARMGAARRGSGSRYGGAARARYIRGQRETKRQVESKRGGGNRRNQWGGPRGSFVDEYGRDNYYRSNKRYQKSLPDYRSQDNLYNSSGYRSYKAKYTSRDMSPGGRRRRYQSNQRSIYQSKMQSRDAWGR